MSRPLLVTALLAAAGLAGCATGAAGPDALQRAAKADEGVVLDVRPIIRAKPIMVAVQPTGVFDVKPAAAAPAAPAPAPKTARRRAAAAPARPTPLMPPQPPPPGTVQTPPAQASAATAASGRATAPPTTSAGTALPAPTTLPTATAEAPVELGVNVVADTPAGQPVLGLAYTVRRASDGATIQVAQPPGAAIAVGAKVRILYEPRIRLAPAA